MFYKNKFKRGRYPRNWKGGVKISNGYIYYLLPKHPNSDQKGYIKRARIVVEKKINRYLKPYEIVHHIDGNRQNDKEENLKLMLREEHTSRHMKGHKYGIGNKNGRGNKGNVSWNKGKKLNLKGRLKLSLSHKGQIPWNKGLKGVQVAWNKGRKKPSLAMERQDLFLLLMRQ